jgi:hypothetical protein
MCRHSQSIGLCCCQNHIKEKLYYLSGDEVVIAGLGLFGLLKGSLLKKVHLKYHCQIGFHNAELRIVLMHIIRMFKPTVVLIR